MEENMGTPDITSDDKLWAALGYPIPLIAIIMLFMEDRRTGRSLNTMLCNRSYLMSFCFWYFS